MQSAAMHGPNVEELNWADSWVIDDWREVAFFR
jgi:hypothetical protein